MSVYRIVYRGKDGRQATVDIEAENRQGVFDELAKRGISAMRIEEAKGKPKKSSYAGKGKSRSTASGGSNGLFKGMLAGAIVVAAGIAAYIFMLPPQQTDEKDTEHKEKRVGRITEVTPSAPGAIPEEPEVKPPKEEPKEPTLRQQMAGLSHEEKLAVIEQKLADTPIPPESTNRTFRTGLEQVMGWVFTTEVGDAPPPLPNLSNFDLVHIEEILDMQNPVRDTDSDKAADAKGTVDFVKKELKKFLEKGGDPQEFLAFYHSELKQAYQERQMVQQQAMQILKEEPDLVFDFLERANQGLADKGSKAAVIPKRVLMRYGLSDEQ